MQWISYCCGVGHSGYAKVSVDGDGAGNIKVEGIKKEIEMPEPASEGPELSIGIGT